MSGPWYSGLDLGLDYPKAPAPPTNDYRTWVLVWVVDPVTKQRHIETKLLIDVKPGDERVRL